MQSSWLDMDCKVRPLLPTRLLVPHASIRVRGCVMLTHYCNSFIEGGPDVIAQPAGWVKLGLAALRNL